MIKVKSATLLIMRLNSRNPSIALKGVLIGFLIAALTGCATPIPVDILKEPADQLVKRQQQTREYDTQDEEKMLSSSASVLQDLGFTIDKGESKLGVIFASKDREVDNAGQIVAATFLTALAAAGGGSSYNYYNNVEKDQKIKVSVVTQKTSDSSKMRVRVNFQRLVWNMAGQLSRIETLQENDLYVGFFEKLSKAVFLEEHKI